MASSPRHRRGISTSVQHGSCVFGLGEDGPLEFDRTPRASAWPNVLSLMVGRADSERFAAFGSTSGKATDPSHRRRSWTVNSGKSRDVGDAAAGLAFGKTHESTESHGATTAPSVDGTLTRGLSGIICESGETSAPASESGHDAIAEFDNALKPPGALKRQPSLSNGRPVHQDGTPAWKSQTNLSQLAAPLPKRPSAIALAALVRDSSSLFPRPRSPYVDDRSGSGLDSGASSPVTSQDGGYASSSMFPSGHGMRRQERQGVPMPRAAYQNGVVARQNSGSSFGSGGSSSSGGGSNGGGGGGGSRNAAADAVTPSNAGPREQSTLRAPAFDCGVDLEGARTELHLTASVSRPSVQHTASAATLAAAEATVGAGADPNAVSSSRLGGTATRQSFTLSKSAYFSNDAAAPEGCACADCLAGVGAVLEAEEYAGNLDQSGNFSPGYSEDYDEDDVSGSAGSGASAWAALTLENLHQHNADISRLKAMGLLSPPRHPYTLPRPAAAAAAAAAAADPAASSWGAKRLAAALLRCASDALRDVLSYSCGACLARSAPRLESAGGAAEALHAA